MDMYILALSGKYSISGVWCLAAIPILIMSFIFYAKGPVAGAGLNATIAIICCLGLANPGGGGGSPGILDNILSNNDSGWIANESQTKWMKKNEADTGEGGAVFIVYDLDVCRDQKFIPAKRALEMRKANLAAGRYEYTYPQDEYYIYNKIYSSPAVKAHLGKPGGIPQWVWHPAAPIYIFGFMGLPALIGGVIISNKLR